MRGLRKYIPPFAPDQSGAAAVLYDMGGIIVICDAGGCTGNVCGFDEPRWFSQKSAIFSAGLRDMDAILGRDDRLVEKLSGAASRLNANFAAIIGTPVPSVIATDYYALRRAAQKKTGLPVIAVDTNGMELYDAGAEKAYLELFRAFAEDGVPVKKGSVGVIGTIPLDMTSPDAGEKIKERLLAGGWNNVACYGMGAAFEQVKMAGGAEKNIVVSPAGLKAAQYLEKRFGTPYEVGFPLADVLLDGKELTAERKKILIVHQQVIANSLRERIRVLSDAEITVASWFMLKKELRERGDAALREEDDLVQLAGDGYDLILGDGIFRCALKNYEGEFAELPHFAVSGKM